MHGGTSTGHGGQNRNSPGDEDLDNDLNLSHLALNMGKVLFAFFQTNSKNDFPKMFE
jgi:hypothetical protein